MWAGRQVGSRQVDRQAGAQAGGRAVGQVGIQVGRRASFEPAEGRFQKLIVLTHKITASHTFHAKGKECPVRA